MIIVGRITADATVQQTKNEKQVVHFSVAVNDYYKPKGAAEGTKFTTFFNCSYWRSTFIAERLKKGALVEVTGRIYVNAYKGANGEAKASLNCHVSEVKIHSTTKELQPNNAATSNDDVADDLPF
jgi:single-strand DNA-binding protein